MRKDGFYWVKLNTTWMIGCYNNLTNQNHAWSIFGMEKLFSEDDLDEIDETPITPPSTSKFIPTSQTLKTLKETLADFPDCLLVTKVRIEMHNKFSVQITEFNTEENGQ